MNLYKKLVDNIIILYVKKKINLMNKMISLLFGYLILGVSRNPFIKGQLF